ncbi:Zinc finger CCCH domain-containing protein 15 [Lamellibrachia satsuma]|nr:Zinc finger CCCH domain-containing protein 15 [Lamellibrachia satsuma]
MPPKGKKNEPSKKTENKKKEKVIEDKTFGLKNKKGNKQQKFIKMVENQVKQGNQSARKASAVVDPKKKKEDEKAALNALFKPVEQKVSKGVDPKSVLCAFFKAGMCKKGDKCKFSHDMNLGRKGAKRSVYDDARQEADNMESWDEAKLEEVVDQKHGESNKKMPQTAIICKYFLDAVENSKYGWFWQCPNGDGCHYRHALPPGFVLKKDKQKVEKELEISLEELIEKERAALNSQNLTKVTLATFLKWKEKKRKEKIAKASELSSKKKTDYKAGRMIGISGREMFEFNPDLMTGDDDDAAGDIVYERDEDDIEEVEAVYEIKLDDLVETEVDDSGTIQRDGDRIGGTAAVNDRLEGATVNGSAGDTGSNVDDESNKLDMAAALPPGGDAAAGGGACADIDVEIDENLFDGDDLDLVEDELDSLDLDD